MVISPVFLDTSILVQGFLEFGPGDESAHRVMAGMADGKFGVPLTAWHCCLEFFAVTTRMPEEFRISAEEAYTLLQTEILGRMKIVDLPASARGPFLLSAVQAGVKGGRLYDAHIAEVARLAKAGMVVTGNPRHFASLSGHGIPVLSAAEFLTRTHK